ncbi:MAG: hypothetical protein NTX50_12525 [Candidatus Sumerlaeota bacterium]|nr:hypothetical protein [Candidatus Sumerlaeota bacterium]
MRQALPIALIFILAAVLSSGIAADTKSPLENNTQSAAPNSAAPGFAFPNPALAQSAVPNPAPTQLAAFDLASANPASTQSPVSNPSSANPAASPTAGQSVTFVIEDKAQSPKAAPSIGESLAREALHAISVSVRWLEKNQQHGGSWSDANFPAMTGFAVSAILRSPEIASGERRSEAAERGLKFILSCVREDGGIYRDVEGVKGGGMPNYNTALCLIALLDANNSSLRGTIENARRYLVKGQHQADDVYKGGMGYDAATGRAYADMSNTCFALDALHRSEPLEPGDSKYHLDKEAAIGFLARCQHLREFNSASWVSESDGEKGGFIYHPLESKAGIGVSADGATTYLIPYGSITYAGALSFLNVGLKPDSPQVKAALKWSARHWSLEQNPRLNDMSFYYYCLAMSRALDAAGLETLDTPKGKVSWRAALIQKLLALQRVTDKEGLGYWRNDNNRWFENDPNLVTCYSLLALETALQGQRSK